MADKEFIDNWDKEIEKLTQEQIDNYYQKDITDGLSDEQRAYLYFKDQAEAYAEVMDIGEDNFPPDQPEGKGPTEKDLYKNNPDRANIISDIEMNNNIPKGSISKMGLALDPIAEGLEFALKGIGLGSIAQWWVKAEAANFLAGLIRGAGAASGVAQLGQSQALMGEEFTADADAIKNAFAQNLGSQMKLSPSLWLENKYAESNLGKGETPTEQGYNWAKNALGFGK